MHGQSETVWPRLIMRAAVLSLLSAGLWCSTPTLSGCGGKIVSTHPDAGGDAGDIDAGDWDADVVDVRDAGYEPDGDAGPEGTITYLGGTELWTLEGSEGHLPFAATSVGGSVVSVSVTATSDEALLPVASVRVRCDDDGSGGCAGHLVVVPAPGRIGSGSVELLFSNELQSVPVTIQVTVERRVDISTGLFVSPTATGGGDGTLASPWTLGEANANAQPGDTVVLLPGTYLKAIAPRRDGTAADPIRFVAAARRTAVIEELGGEPYLLYLEGRSHVEVSGIRFESSGTQYLANLNSAAFLTLRDCTVLGVGFLSRGDVRIIDSNNIDLYDSRIQRSFHNIIVSRNTPDMRFQGLVLDRAGHTPMFLDYGLDRLILRGNAFLGSWGRVGGISGGPDGLLYERNVIMGSLAAGRSAGSDIKMSGVGAIIRYNKAHDNGPKFLFNVRDYRAAAQYDHWRFYNNVVHYNSTEAVWVDNKGNGVFRDIIFQNNVFLDNDIYSAGYHFRGNRINGQVRMVSNIFYWSFGSQPDPTEVVGCPDEGNLFQDPGYADVSRRSYVNLQSGSPLPEGGTPMTSTTAAGQGTNVPVSDTWWIFDGFGRGDEQGDWIQVGNQRAQVVEADHAAGTITVDASISWAAGDPVSLAWDGTSPPLGSFEQGVDLEHMAIVSSAGTVGSSEVLRFEIVGLPEDARVVWHLGDGTRATGHVVEHVYSGGEGRYGVRAYVYGGMSWQRSAAAVMVSDFPAGSPLILLDFDRDDEIALIKSDSWSRPLPDVRVVSSPTGQACRFDVSTSDGGLETQFLPFAPWHIDTYPYLVLRYRADSGLSLDFLLEAYPNTGSLAERLTSVGGTGGGAVTIEADGQWHRLVVDVSMVRNAFPEAEYLRGFRITGPEGQGIGKGYAYDVLCVATQETDCP